MKTICSSPDDTRAHAAKFAKKIFAGALILLQGELGAGKTEWVKGFVAGTGCDCEVTSPTFTLLHEYRGGKFPVYHWDIYRLDKKTDWSVLDFHQQDPNGITIVEWPERFPEKWPRDAIKIVISILPDEKRSIQIKNLS